MKFDKRNIGRIMSLCLSLKESGHDAFCHFYSHVDEITVHIHVGGWATDSNPTAKFECETNRPDAAANLFKELTKFVNDNNLLKKR